MIKQFFPRKWVSSVWDIPYGGLRKKGIRGLVFDVDNTLARHGEPADEKTIKLFEKLRSLGFKTCLLSNNKEERVKAFARSVDSDYLFKGGKPGTKGYQKAMQVMATQPAETIAVGDQLFTDIWGANRAGIYSILVSPINPQEEIQIVLKRYLEKPLLRLYQKQHPGEPASRKRGE